MNALWSWGQREMPHGTVHSPVSLLIRKQLQYSYDHITFFFCYIKHEHVSEGATDYPGAQALILVIMEKPSVVLKLICINIKTF